MIRRLSAYATLFTLIIGFSLGLAVHGLPASVSEVVVGTARVLGRLWLAGLQMTIIPLVFSLLVTGVASTAEAGRTSARALAIMAGLLTASALVGAVVTPLLLHIWPQPAAAGDAVRAVLGAHPELPAAAPLEDIILGVVPTNVVTAAAANGILPLLFFAGVFGFAITQLSAAPRAQLIGLFTAIADAMLVIVGWVLKLAPLGVLMLSLVVGATAGFDAAGVLAHYVFVVVVVGLVCSLLPFLVATLGGRVPLLAFARAIAPVQALAAGTQSSLACLPATLAAAGRLGLPLATAEIVLPLAVAAMRFTGSAMNFAAGLYLALALGIQVTPALFVVAVLAAIVSPIGTASLPNQVGLVPSVAPVAAVLGVPIEAIALLIPVETLPDIVRTVGNVTANLATTAWVARLEKRDDEPPPERKMA